MSLNHDDETDWSEFVARLSPLERAVPATIPPWRFALLGLREVTVVVAAGIGLLPILTGLSTLFNSTLGLGARPVALGATVLIWGLLSFSALLVMGRRASGGAAGADFVDIALALALYASSAVWMAGLAGWMVGTAGSIDFDMVGRETLIWPVAISVATLLLTARVWTGPLLAVALWLAAAALAIFVLGAAANDTVAALRDSDVSGAGWVVGMASAIQVMVLAAWLTLRWPWRSPSRDVVG